MLRNGLLLQVLMLAVPPVLLLGAMP